MNIKNLSITFHTDKIKECIHFYQKYFNAKVTFDADWYVVICLPSEDKKPIFLSFQNLNEFKRTAFTGGTTLNIETSNVDLCYAEIKQSEVLIVDEIADHEWGDRSFCIKDPIGNLLYIYSEREISDKYKDAIKKQ
ncbi:VOC family protein [uncultured Bacteroides sp.]|uniref:VOC family protein n=1 Tax=uncultured Bacteroides sp. TaxID=162156 RepID=UPI002AAAC9B0|nr:VOC family protein [uncultured Bacteroides sp.]